MTETGAREVTLFFEAAARRGNQVPVRRQLSRAVAARSGSGGFTLIELMVVVAIVAILTAIAYPAYTNYITKTHRVAAEGCLSEYSNYMERYYTTNLSYKSATLPNLDCASSRQTGANYSYSLLAGTSSTAYTVQAIPVSGSAQATRDAACGTLSLDQAGTRKPTPAGGTKCW